MTREEMIEVIAEITDQWLKMLMPFEFYINTPFSQNFAATRFVLELLLKALQSMVDEKEEEGGLA